MKPMPALALIAVGAILAFAVNAPGGVISWSSAGWVLILTGIAGVLLPYLLPQRSSWVRRVTRSSGDRRMPVGWTFRRRPDRRLVTVPTPQVEEVIPAPGAAPAGAAPAEEVVEEYFED
ncbi:MAG TPA: hypothetical protein VLW44_15415 [Streptosporangiaceae bacterium]|nr:hypothetical protein [Streptosporangiaceae bacterium]